MPKQKRIDGFQAIDIYHMDGCPIKTCASRNMTSARIDWDHTTTPALFKWYKNNRIKLFCKYYIKLIIEKFRK